jgi:hypothetical protein
VFATAGGEFAGSEWRKRTEYMEDSCEYIHHWRAAEKGWSSSLWGRTVG